MIIREMTATFGKLEKQTLKLEPGLNILQGANEEGKSTWSAFLRAMLYGIPTSQRDKAGFLAEKNRYAPWSGAAMEGSMTLDWNGREILLRRSGKGANPFGNVQATDAATGEKIPEICVEKPGEVLLGIEREVFERSAFVGQGAMAVDGAPALEKRIAALLSSGQEEVSFTQVQRQLKDWRNRRQHNKTGLLPRLEEEMEREKTLLSRSRNARLQREEGLAGLNALREEKTRLEQEKGIHKAKREGEKWQHFKECCQDYLRVKEEYDSLTAQFEHLPSKEELLESQQDYQYAQSLSGALRLKESERQELERREPEPEPGKPVTAGQIAVGVVSAVAAAILFLLAGTYLGGYSDLAVLTSGKDLVSRVPDLKTLQLICAVAGAAVGGVVSALVIHLSRDRARRQREAENRLAWEEELARLDREAAALRSEREEKLSALLLFVHRFSPTVTNEFGISAALSRGLQGEELLLAARGRLESAQKTVRMVKATLEGEQPPAEQTGTARYSYQETVARLAVTMEELSRKERMVAAAEGELRTLGDADAAEARLEQLEEEYRVRQEELAALDLALAAMEEANASVQARFSPALNRRAGELMGELTGGKYDQLILNRAFEAQARQAGEVLPRSVLSLSGGTADQLYLAVRLAVCDLALPDGGRVPLVLDDALVCFDDARMALALEHLYERGKGQQILLFTCHSREQAWLAAQSGSASASDAGRPGLF